VLQAISVPLSHQGKPAAPITVSVSWVCLKETCIARGHGVRDSQNERQDIRISLRRSTHAMVKVDAPSAVSLVHYVTTGYVLRRSPVVFPRVHPSSPRLTALKRKKGEHHTSQSQTRLSPHPSHIKLNNNFSVLKTLRQNGGFFC
jgi:hypothetical protein